MRRDPRVVISFEGTGDNGIGMRDHQPTSPDFCVSVASQRKRRYRGGLWLSFATFP